jgi:hypothetical protein
MPTHQRSAFRSNVVFILALAASVGIWRVSLWAAEWTSGIVWPEPKVVDPGPPGGPPSDAIVLFDGKSLAAWEGGDQWLVDDGVATVQGGGIQTKQGFGDIQLHVEWAAPIQVEGEGQGRGNSGIYLMHNYEIQILDSYNNATYYDGQAGALYKTMPPLVNACRPPGEWQTYDIVFRAPRFDADGHVKVPARVTVLHNGVVIQNHTEVKGTTYWDESPRYTAHADKMPIHIQHHGNPVRFRNIWVRELGTMEGTKTE